MQIHLSSDLLEHDELDLLLWIRDFPFFPFSYCGHYQDWKTWLWQLQPILDWDKSNCWHATSIYWPVVIPDAPNHTTVGNEVSLASSRTQPYVLLYWLPLKYIAVARRQQHWSFRSITSADDIAPFFTRSKSAGSLDATRQAWGAFFPFESYIHHLLPRSDSWINRFNHTSMWQVFNTTSYCDAFIWSTRRTMKSIRLLLYQHS